MRSNLFFIFIFLFLILITPGQSPAQDNPGDTIPRIRREPPQIEGIDGAERLIRMGEFERAADFLEVLYEKHPKHRHIQNMLASCYEQNKSYGKLLMLLKNRLATETPNYILLRSVGRTYVMMGFPDSAQSFMYGAGRLAAENMRGFSSIADIYHKFGHYDYETAFIDSSRILTGDSTLLADKMGDALAARKRFAEATLEYLQYMKMDTLTARTTTMKLEAMMTFPESADTVMAIIADQIKSQSNNKHLLNTYGRLLMRQNRYGEAFDFFRNMDSVKSNQGGNVIHFMELCNGAGQYDFTLKAADYLLQRRPESTLRNNILFSMTVALTATGNYEKALAAYHEIAADVVRPAHRAEAFVKIGLLYKDYIKDLVEAEKYFEKVIKDFPRGQFYVQARFGLADVDIRKGDFDSAVANYELIRNLEMPEDILEKLDYALAEINLFRGKYDDAVTGYKQVISRYPRGFYVNDAIQYSLIIDETREQAADHIDLFSSAEYFRYTGQQDSLEYYLTKICRVGIPSLAPISYLRLGQMYYDQERYDKAVESIDNMVSLYSTSYFLPYGIKLKADIRLLSPESRGEALELYRNLLEEYPTYPFAAEIRDIIRREMPPDRI